MLIKNIFGKFEKKLKKSAEMKIHRDGLVLTFPPSAFTNAGLLKKNIWKYILADSLTKERLEYMEKHFGVIAEVEPAAKEVA